MIKNDKETFWQLTDAAQKEPFLKDCKSELLADKLFVCLVKSPVCFSYFDFANLKICKHKLKEMILERTKS